MPQAPLIDLDSIDLSRSVIELDRIQEVLKQRGTFVMIEGVLHLDLEAEIIVGYKDIRSDDWWTQDHIPGRPIFPGAMMVEAAAQLCTFDFHQREPNNEGSFIGFTGIDKTRFRAAVEPDCRMIFVGKKNRCRRTMFNYKTQGFVEGRMVFESEISGMVF